MDGYRRIELENPFEGAPVFYRAVSGSTMQDARELAGQGLPSGTAVVAGFQTDGRGRFPERSWHARPDESLLFTLILRLRDIRPPAAALPLLAGLGTALALEREFGLSPRVKWPNDLLIGGKKICGILCVSDDQAVLAGVGVNCRQVDFPAELGGKAVSLAQVLKRPVAPHDLLPAVLREIRELVIGEPAWRPMLENRLFKRGERVLFSFGIGQTEHRVEGLLEGIDEFGQILIRLDEHEKARAFPAGELVIL